MVFSSQILGRGRIASSRHGLVVALFTGLTALSALAGCGQKGSLYMPVPPVTVPAAARQPTPPGTLVVPAPALPAASATR